MKQLTLYRYDSVSKELRPLQDHYLLLAGKYARVDVRELKDPGRILTLGDLPEPDGNTWLLTEHGRTFNTTAFTEKVFGSDLEPTTVILMNAYGCDKLARNSFSKQLALSELTMAHDLAWIVLLEQVFRAGNIRAGGSYHK